MFLTIKPKTKLRIFLSNDRKGKPDKYRAYWWHLERNQEINRVSIPMSHSLSSMTTASTPYSKALQ